MSGSRTARLPHLLLGRSAFLSLDLRLRVRVTCAVMSALQAEGHVAHRALPPHRRHLETSGDQ